MVEFLMTHILFTFAVIGGYLMFMQWWRKRLTFVTDVGAKVYDMGMESVLRFDLPKSEFDLADRSILKHCEEFGFPRDRLEKALGNNKIFLNPHIMRNPANPSQRKYEFVSGYYYMNNLHIGSWPKIKDTSYVHEVVHDAGREINNDRDSNHQCDCWGLVGRVTEELKNEDS